jgi:hypothetical protein
MITRYSPAFLPIELTGVADSHFAPENNRWAINPAMGGKKKVPALPPTVSYEQKNKRKCTHYNSWNQHFCITPFVVHALAHFNTS